MCDKESNSDKVALRREMILQVAAGILCTRENEKGRALQWRMEFMMMEMGGRVTC